MATDIQFRQIPVTAVAVEQYRPAMDSCMVGMRLYRTCAPTAPDPSDPGEHPEEHGRPAQGHSNRYARAKRGPKASQVQK